MAESTIPQEVAQEHNRINTYADRWDVDDETGALIPRAVATARPAPSAVPSYTRLATGVATTRAIAMDQGYNDGWGSDNFAAWGNAWDGTYSEQSQRERAAMGKALYYWRKDPIVYKCTKLLTQLSNAPIAWDCEDDDTQSFFKVWFEQAMGTSFRVQWFTEFFRSGLVAAMKTLVEYVPRDFKPNKAPQAKDGMVKAEAELQAEADAEAKREWAERIVKANAEAKASYVQAKAELERLETLFAAKKTSEAKVKAQAAVVIDKQYEWAKGMIPGGYSILDPMAIDIEGPAGLEFLKQPFLRLDPLVRSAAVSPTAQQSPFLAALPVELVTQIKKGSPKVWLSPNIVNITFNDKQDYERYPTPMISHAFTALAMKDLLIEADKRTAMGIRDRILKVTIGDKEFPVLDNSELNAVQNLFRNPAKTLTLFWNHTLKIEWIEMPTDGYMEKEKYAIWDNQIRTCYGIGPIFTGTSETSGAVGNSMMNFEGLKQEILTAQELFLEQLRAEVKLVRASLGITKDCTPRFVNIFGNVVEFMAGLQTMVTNGNLDNQTLLETLGFDFATVKRRQEKIKKLKDKGIFTPVPSSNNMGPGGGVPTGGKPAKQPLANNNKNKRGKSQPKTKAAACMLVVPEPDLPVLVVDAEMVDDGERAILADFFKLAQASQVFTCAEYKATYGREVVFVKPWPELTQAETVSVTRQAIATLAMVDRDTEAACKTWVASQAKSGGGKKAPYLRTERREEIRREVLNKAVAGLAVADPHWNDRLKDAQASLVDSGLSEEEVVLQAAISLSRRHAKLSVAAGA